MTAILRPAGAAALGPIAEALDAATAGERLAWLRSLSPRDVRVLYDLAAGTEPVRPEHMAAGPGEVVIHHGRNSLPLFRSFQKRFCLRDGRVQGYNHNPGGIAWFTGPGHFTCVFEDDALVVDYIAMPDGVPDGFPPLADNDHGTGKLVFGGMRDIVRRVSRHCTVGTATKGGRAIGQGFVLVRETPLGEDGGA